MEETNVHIPTKEEIYAIAQDRPFLTTGEIVKLARVHPNTVAVWRARGFLVARDKIAVAFLYDRTEVLTFLSSRRPRRGRKAKVVAKKANDEIVQKVENT